MGCKRTFYITDEKGRVHRIRVYSEEFSHPFVERAVEKETYKLARKLNKISRFTFYGVKEDC